MTMFPAHHHHRQINLINNKNNIYGTGGYEEYGGGCSYNYNNDYCSFISLSGGGGGGGSDLLMAHDQDESRTEINSINNDEELLATAANYNYTRGSTSKSKDTNINIINQQEININKEEEEEEEVEEDDDRGWLQLSLGSSGHTHRPPSVELDLLPGGSGSNTNSSGGGGDETLSLALTAPVRQQQRQQLSFQVPITTTAGAAFFLQPNYQRGWSAVAIDPAPPIPMALASHQQYDGTYVPFRPNYPLSMTTPPLLGQVTGGRPLDFHSGPPLRMDFRVVDPPPRPHSGVWFILQASQNQIKEPYLPQVPKSYLRIKDGRTTTVRLLIKYLVDKLKLDSEFEIEITCKGQQLLPFLTLQHVRDNIWNMPRNDVVFPHSSTTIVDHLMVLNYGRIA